MKGFTFPTNNHNLNQSSSYFKDNKRIPYTKSQNNDHRNKDNIITYIKNTNKITAYNTNHINNNITKIIYP